MAEIKSLHWRTLQRTIAAANRKDAYRPCPCQEVGEDGTKDHTEEQYEKVFQQMYADSAYRYTKPCANHVENYHRSPAFKLVSSSKLQEVLQHKSLSKEESYGNRS